ncbi:MAG: hypothetical protein JNL13_00275 [Chitinophagaceae bacterium]|nr:hypothetical protein [Chitinophagaceae bacterium]
MITALPFLFLVACIKVNTDEKEEQPKDYACECTYISGKPEPEKNEVTKLSTLLQAEARVECSKLEDKYMSQFYSGTCVLK